MSIFSGNGKSYRSTIEAVKGVIEEGKKRQNAISQALASQIKKEDRMKRLQKLKGMIPTKEEEQPMPPQLSEEEIESSEERQKQFEDTVSLDWDDEQKQRFNRKKTVDGNYINFAMANYQKRNMLKDAKTKELLPASAFAVNLSYPARGFRDTVAKKNK